MMFIHNLIWGEVGLTCLLILSFYFTIRLNCPQFTHLGLFFSSLKQTFNASKAHEMSQWNIIATSLGAVMGIGNLVGVASCIIAGGPGALFWLFISSIIVSSLKYSEILLTGIVEKNVHHEIKRGVMYYMEICFHSKFISYIYVITILIVSLVMGNMIVSNAICTSIDQIMGIPKVIGGLILALFLAGLLIKGLKSIINFNTCLVPYMIIIYFIICFIIIGMHLNELPRIFNLIITDAFNFKSVGGGFVGLALKYGVSRGIYSNEAGMGTCTLAYGKSKQDPKVSAMFGVMEVFIDSILMCSLSGIVLLLADVEVTKDATIYLLTAFNIFMPNSGSGFILLSLIFFGLSSILGWYFYGIECVDYLNKKKFFKLIYSVLFIIFIFLGSIIDVNKLWIYADIFNGILIILNIITLILMRKIIINYEKNH